MLKTKHQIRWFVWAGDEKILRTSTMRGSWGYDAECSCGWQSRTGGALERYVKELVQRHKREALECIGLWGCGCDRCQEGR